VRAVLPVAAEAGKIDARIALCGHGARGNLPLERVILVIREAIVFKTHRAVAVVVELDPAVARRVVARHHLADGKRVKVLRGKHAGERHVDLSRVLRARCRNPAVAVGAVNSARVRNIGVQ